MAYDFDKAFLPQDEMQLYTAIDPKARDLYGHQVRAMELSNREYQHRFNKFSRSNNMKPPPSSGRIFAGYLVVRKLGSPDQYETWMPDHIFDEVYARIDHA